MCLSSSLLTRERICRNDFDSLGPDTFSLASKEIEQHGFCTATLITRLRFVFFFPPCRFSIPKLRSVNERPAQFQEPWYAISGMLPSMLS